MIMPTDTNHGSFAEYVIADVKNIAIVPHKLSSGEAASVPLIAQTSYQALTDYCKVKEGHKVLILGGSTATGLMGIQIAKNLGASQVIVTSTQEALCKSVGADQVINYREDNWWEVLKVFFLRLFPFFIPSCDISPTTRHLSPTHKNKREKKLTLCTIAWEAVTHG